MAKKKETVPEDQEAVIGDDGITINPTDNQQEIENQDEEVIEKETNNALHQDNTEPLKDEAKKNQSETKQNQSAVISDMADKILQKYPTEKELYIDSHGGVFTKRTKPIFVKNAILYKNPYYNK
jgi:hypothetical protein